MGDVDASQSVTIHSSCLSLLGRCLLLAMKFRGMKAPVYWYHALVSNVHWESEKKWAEETKSQRREEANPWKIGVPCVSDVLEMR